jgi:hypothetical protein
MFVLSSDLRRVLCAAACALLGIFAVSIVALALPLQLLQPSWIERMCAAVLGGVSFPLVALVFLVMVAEGTPGDKDVSGLKNEAAFITSLRRLALFVAIGFALMIPLQTWAGVEVVQQAMRNDKEQLKPFTRALDLIRIAETPDAMLFALRSIPGAPSNLSGELSDPLSKVRQQLIAQIEPQLKARQNQLKDVNRQRWKQGILRWVKDGFIAAFSAFGFAAIGRMGPLKPTLLGGFQQRRQTAKLYADAKKSPNPKSSR